MIYQVDSTFLNYCTLRNSMRSLLTNQYAEVITFHSAYYIVTNVKTVNDQIAAITLREVIPATKYSGPPWDARGLAPNLTGLTFAYDNCKWVVTTDVITLLPTTNQLNMFQENPQ